MSSTYDGLSNVEAITAQISALQAQQNSSPAGLSGTAAPSAFILQTQQNFNSMLQSLMTPTDDSGDQSGSSDPFASLTNDQSLQMQIQNLSNPSASGAQNLTTLDQTSQLLGKQAIYQDSTGAQATGVVSKILLDQQGNAIVEMEGGLQIRASAIIGLKQ